MCEKIKGIEGIGTAILLIAMLVFFCIAIPNAQGIEVDNYTNLKNVQEAINEGRLHPANLEYPNCLLLPKGLTFPEGYVFPKGFVYPPPYEINDYKIDLPIKQLPSLLPPPGMKNQRCPPIAFPKLFAEHYLKPTTMGRSRMLKNVLPGIWMLAEKPPHPDWWIWATDME